MIEFQPQFTLKISNNVRLSLEPLVMIIVFVIIFAYLISYYKKNKELTVFQSFMMPFISVMCALVGGRIWYFISTWEGIDTFIFFFDLRRGGLVSLGMVFGGFVGLLFFKLWTRYKSIDFDLKKAGDVIIVPVSLGFFFYRLFGSFLYGDIKGIVSENLPWGLIIKDTVHHPISIYLALNALFIFVILKLRENKKYFNGEISLWFLFLYSLNRFWIEFFAIYHNSGRIASTKILGLTELQLGLIAIAFIVSLELFANYYLIKKLNLDSTKERFNYFDKNSWLLTHKKFISLFFNKHK